jgi:16S rRNA (cytosine967-C5)-methyltransferase
MKWYPNLVLAAAQALADIFDEGYYADKVIERTLKSDPRWGSRDRAFIAESVYEVVRWYRRLDVLAQPQPDNLDAYQRLIGVHYLLQGETLPDWPVFQGLAENGGTQQSRLAIVCARGLHTRLAPRTGTS